VRVCLSLWLKHNNENTITSVSLRLCLL